MPRITNISPELLRDQHGLTPFQINKLFERVIYQEGQEEKVSSFEKVKEFINVADALRGEGVSFIPLKGPLLSYRLYGDATRRYYGDLDILVGPGSIAVAAAILERLGYRAEAPEWPESRREQHILLTHAKNIAFTNAVTGIWVELHWRLVKGLPVGFKLYEEVLKRNQVVLSFAGQSFSGLSNELELLFLVIHGGNHWWRRLMWLVDIRDYLLTQPIDQRIFLELTEAFKASRMVGLCNAVLAEYFPDAPRLPGEKPVSPFMARFSLNMIRSQKELTTYFYPRIFQTVRFALISFPGMRYKLRTIRNYLFVAEFFGRNSFFSSVPLFYLYGPVRLAIKRLRE